MLRLCYGYDKAAFPELETLTGMASVVPSTVLDSRVPQSRTDVVLAHGLMSRTGEWSKTPSNVYPFVDPDERHPANFKKLQPLTTENGIAADRREP